MELQATKTDQSHVQSVQRALQLLDMLGQEKREMSLTEIAGTLGWPKSTTHGIIATLRDCHYVDQSPDTGRYRLGIRLFELGNVVARSWDIRSVALPFMRLLNEKLGEMVQLATQDDGEVLYLEKMDSHHMMRIVSEIGARLPMHCSGLGKVLLAYKSPSEVRWIISKRGMPAMTARTITSLPALERELEQVRRQGYAMDDMEIMDSLRCIAAPVRDKDGEVRYAISVSGLANSMCGEHLDDALQALLQTANDLSFAMGYRDNNKTNSIY